MTRALSYALSACLGVLLSAPSASADVGVSVHIGQPGFYGRIDLGNVPSPRVIYAQPVIIAPAPVAVVQRPIYLHVPPGHARDWAKHCGRYNACGQQTYFVEEEWYRTVYVPARGHGRHLVQHREASRHGYKHDRPRAGRGHDRGHGDGHDKGHGRSKGKSRD